MKSRHIFFITIILLAILSVSAVSATDNLSNSTVGTTANGGNVPISTVNENPLASGNSNQSSISSGDLTKYYKNDSQYHATFFDFNGTPIVNESITINVNGGTYHRTTNQEGSITFNINLNPGNYTLTVKNPITDETASNSIVVLPTINGSDIVKYYKNGTQYYVNVVDGQGNPLVNSKVEFNINGVFYYRTTNDKGVAKMNINLNSDDYVITAKNLENNETTSNKIKVVSTINGKDVKLYYKNGTQYVVNVIDGQGNPLVNTKVRLNINGVFYNRTTDENGTARLNINLNSGKYIITAYNPVTTELASNTVEVLNTVIPQNAQAGGDISLEYKAGKYTVELHEKDGSLAVNKSVSFNINGVFYKRTSNEKGLASLNINLLPGNYIITADYDGCKVSNTLKIRVTPSIKIINTTVKSGDYLQFRLTEKNSGNPITGDHYGIVYFNDTTYGTYPDSTGLCKIGVGLNPGNYLFYFGTIDDGWYSSLLVGNTIKII